MSSPTQYRLHLVIPSGNGHEDDPLEGAMETTMRDVHAGMRVTIEGRTEVFTVLRVDRKRNLADLLRRGSVRKVANGIPLVLLRLAPEQNSNHDQRASA